MGGEEAPCVTADGEVAIDAKPLDVTLDGAAAEDEVGDIGEEVELGEGPEEVKSEKAFKSSGAGALNILPLG